MIIVIEFLPTDYEGTADGNRSVLVDPLNHSKVDKDYCDRVSTN